MILSLRRAEYSILEICLPAQKPAPFGVLLIDPESDRVYQRFREDVAPDADDAEVLAALPDDLAAKAREMGGETLLAWFEDSLSNTLRISDRRVHGGALFRERARPALRTNMSRERSARARQGGSLRHARPAVFAAGGGGPLRPGYGSGTGGLGERAFRRASRPGDLRRPCDRPLHGARDSRRQHRDFPRVRRPARARGNACWCGAAGASGDGGEFTVKVYESEKTHCRKRAGSTIASASSPSTPNTPSSNSTTTPSTACSVSWSRYSAPTKCSGAADYARAVCSAVSAAKLSCPRARSKSTRMVCPSCTSPESRRRASGVSISFWMARFSGRAP